MTNARQVPRTSVPGFARALGGGSKRRRDRDGESNYENRGLKRLRPSPASCEAVRLSQDDANDTESVGKSTISNEDRRPRKTNQVRQEEFRSSQPGTPSSRRRRNRTRLSLGARERRHSGGVQHSPGLSRSMSPDELQNSSPPPVKSDLLPSTTSAMSKSSRPLHNYTGSSFLPFDAAKHRRKNVAHEDISDESDDELANDDAKQRARKKPQASSKVAQVQNTASNFIIRLHSAVSGKHTFQPERDVRLVLDEHGTSWSLVTEERKPIGHPWLQLDVERMTRVVHNPHSEVVIIHRPQAKCIPAMLVLRFEHEKASRLFIRGVEKTGKPVKVEEKSP